MENISSKFTPLEQNAQLELNGGGVLLVVGLITLGAAAGLAADEYVERTTGDDIATHVGNKISEFGNWISGN
jgi:hypothetical protein